MASHLEMLLSNLQPSVKSDKSTSMSGSYKEYVWENPVNFGCKKSVKGIVIPRPPSMDFSYVISMNVYFHCLSKEQDTMLFKTGNVHKCTEHGKTQSVAFIDRKTGYIHFKTKTRKQKELQITEIETDTSVEVNKWVSLVFVRKRLLKASDHLYVFIDGKIAGTTDVAYGNDTVETKSDNMIEASKNKENDIQKINISNALYADVSAKQNVADTRPTRLPLYVGVPSMSPHYAASATATEIAEKYLRDNDNVMFEGSVSSVAVSNNLIDAMKILEASSNLTASNAISTKLNKAHMDMEWILDLMYRCTLTQEPRGSLASLRIISILLTIINCGGAQTFNILHSTSPGNKLKALQILSAVLVEVIPQNIESDETFCLSYTPETILNHLFFIYTNLDCFIATSTAPTQSKR